MDITLIIITITVLISFFAFESPKTMSQLLLSPYMVVHRKEWYRVITHGFVHANWMHLLINMLVFYSFGGALYNYFLYISPHASLHFIILYIGSMIFAVITTIIKYRDIEWYRCVGASGAVSAVMFACIFFNPWHKLLLMGVIPIPGIIFGVVYLIYCSYMSKQGGNDGINHDAHLYGAIFGLIYPILINPNLAKFFFNQLVNP